MNSTQSTWRALLIAAAGIVAVTGCGELESKPYERRVPAHARSSKPKKAEPLPIVSQVKPFLLWDENSEELTLDMLKGKVWIVINLVINLVIKGVLHALLQVFGLIFGDDSGFL